MTLMHNPFEGRAEIFFIMYEDIVKTIDPFILKAIKNNQILSESFKNIIRLDDFKDLDDNNLLRLCIQRTNQNILEYLAKGKFDYDETYKTLKYSPSFFDIYKESELLEMGKNIQLMLNQKFTEKIYIYTEEYDIRVHLDIQETYNNMEKINYVWGDFTKALQDLEGITTIIINNVDYMFDIIQSGKSDYTTVMIPMYGYNYVEIEDNDLLELRLDLESLVEDTICKPFLFSPVKLKEEHFSQIDLNDIL